MQIDWSRYIRTAKEQGLTGIEVVRPIQKKTNRKVNVPEVKRRLAGTESSTLGFEAQTVGVIDLIENDQPQEATLRINANCMTFEFRTLSPEDSVIGILRKINGAADEDSSSGRSCHAGYIADRPEVWLPTSQLRCTRSARD